MKQRLNLREYWDHVGQDNIDAVIERVGSSLGYFRQLRYGQKSCGKDLAMAIIEAAREVTPGWEPDLELLLSGVPREGSGLKRIQPSPEFLRSQKRRARAAA